jgi:hypothetical protein
MATSFNKRSTPTITLELTVNSRLVNFSNQDSHCLTGDGNVAGYCLLKVVAEGPHCKQP